jgi:serine/threonine protein kinase
MKLVLIDFGASAICRMNDNDSTNSSSSNPHYYTDFHGTRQYKPPEYILNKKYTAVESTVWTLGILLYDMCNGQLPFENEKEILEYNMQLKTTLSDEYKELLFDCLQLNPKKRPNLDQILEYTWCKINSEIFDDNFKVNNELQTGEDGGGLSSIYI